ncbi:SDR family oxidoreductase [Ottowia sp.]|uniref:SDR family oxidoreductase n=1 Tax=Ottowia sp. TaxID=1898956 RepID=UPI003A879902
MTESRPESWVLITGAARRLGRELCLAFARQGWNVLGHFRHSAADARTTRESVLSLGVRCEMIEVDLAHPQAAVSLMDAAISAAGTVPRCVVNNASSFESDDATTVSEDQLQAALQTNLVAPLLLGQQQHLRLGQRWLDWPGACSLIHVLDQKVHNLNPDYFSYTVSKLALERAVALQAQALAPRLRVCGVSPGLIYVSGPQSESNFAAARQVNLLRTPIDPPLVTEAVVFLASNAALTGVTLPVDNGQHLVPLERDVMFWVDANGPALEGHQHE